jgi:hypothetical protein
VNALPLLLLIGLAAPPAAPPAEAPAEAPEAGDPADWTRPPSGAREDVALWTTLRDSQNDSVLHMSRIAQASFRIRYGRYYDRLDGLARAAAAPMADEARRLRARIEAAARKADEGIPKTGLKVRVCKYTLLHLDQRLRFPEDKAMAADLPRVRGEARGCIEELVPFAARVRPLAEALDVALADADAFLDREEPAPPPPAPGAPAPGQNEGGHP